MWCCMGEFNRGGQLSDVLSRYVCGAVWESLTGVGNCQRCVK